MHVVPYDYSLAFYLAYETSFCTYFCIEGMVIDKWNFWSRKIEVKTEVEDAKNIFIFSEDDFYADTTFLNFFFGSQSYKIKFCLKKD